MNPYRVTYGALLALSTIMSYAVLTDPYLDSPFQGLMVAFAWVMIPQFLVANFVDLPYAIVTVLLLGSIPFALPFFSGPLSKIKASLNPRRRRQGT